MTDAEAYACLEPTLREVLERPDLEVTPGLSADDVPGWDSFRQISILLALEERFGIEFAAADLDGLRTVGDIVRVLRATAG